MRFFAIFWENLRLFVILGPNLYLFITIIFFSILCENVLFFCDHLMKLEIFNVNYWRNLFFSATMCRNLQYFSSLSCRTDDQFFFNFGTGCLKSLGKFETESSLLQILTWNVWNYHDYYQVFMSWKIATGLEIVKD